MSIGRKIHINEPMGGDGKGPFAATSTELRSVVQNIKAIVVVEPGQWPGRPEIGTPLPQILDSPADRVTESLARTIIQSQVNRHEPRVLFDPVQAVIQNTIDSIGNPISQLFITIEGKLRRSTEEISVKIRVGFER